VSNITALKIAAKSLLVQITTHKTNRDRPGHHHLRGRGGSEPGAEDLQSQCGERWPKLLDSSKDGSGQDEGDTGLRGGKIIATASEHRYDDSSQGNPPTNSWGSNQTPGASGSPGILFFTLSGGYINTDTSYFYPSQS
jgi:hypothetical protein